MGVRKLRLLDIGKSYSMLVSKEQAMYPRPVEQQTGAKVSWLTFDTHEKAMQASLTAEQIAASQWMRGYDFGYHIPGRITKNPDGTFTVTVP